MYQYILHIDSIRIYLRTGKVKWWLPGDGKGWRYVQPFSLGFWACQTEL